MSIKTFTLRATLVLIISLISFNMLFSNNRKSNSEPDFAYPENVAKAAEKQLSNALAESNGDQTVNALIKLDIASTSISPDSVVTMIARIEEIEAAEKNPATKSLLNTLLANIYLEYYTSNKWNFDDRTTVPSETDFTLWSGEQFRDKITGLVNESLANPEALKATPVSDYPLSVSLDSAGISYYPTLYDFACSNAMQILQEISSSDRILPLRSLSVALVYPNAFPIENKRIMEIGDQWVAANPKITPARIAALLARYKYVLNCLADNSADSIFTETIKLYKENISCPAAVEFLLENNDLSDLNEQNLRTLYIALQDFASANSGYSRINEVKGTIARISAGEVLAIVPAQVSPGIPFDIKISSRNAGNVSAKIYALKDSYDDSKRIKRSDLKGKAVDSLNVKFNNSVPFKADTTVKATVNKYGRYVVLINDSITGEAQTFVCSDLAAVTNSVGFDAVVWAANAASGKPVKGAEAVFRQNYPKKVYSPEITDNKGFAKVPKKIKSNYGSFKISLGDDRYLPEVSVNMYEPDSRIREAAFLRSDLALYHPGDSVAVVAFAYSYSTSGRTPLAGENMQLILLNANYQPVDTIKAVTDGYGRADATFTLPKTGLTGHYCVQMAYNSRIIGNYAFMVSDYKLPTYEITLNPTRADGDSVIISGKAMQYSGFPLQGASIEAEVENYRGNWWSYSRSIKFHTDSLTTADDGSFRLILTPDILAAAPYGEGIVTINLTVTSASGENHAASTSFALNRQASISLNHSDVITASEKTVLPAELLNFVNEKIESPLEASFTAADGTAFTTAAEWVSGRPVANLAAIPSGTYNLIVAAPQLPGNVKASAESVVVYNPTDKAAPTDDVVWVYKSQLTADNKSRTAVIVYSTANPDSYILVTTVAGGKVINRNVMHIEDAGIHTLEAHVPKTATSATINLTAFRNFKSSDCNITINCPDPAESLTVKVEHLKNLTVPGTEESFTVTVTDGSDRGVNSAIVLDMYSKALDAIESQSWFFSPSRAYFASLQTDMTDPDSHYSFVWSFGWPNYHNIPLLPIPSLNCYGRSLYHTFRYANDIYYNMATPMTAARGAEVTEKKAMMVESVSYDMADEAEFETADAGSESFTTEEKQQPDVTYRPSEIPLAFFAPKLITDDRGNLSFNFTVPDANTTWILNALAVDSNVNTALAVSEVISQKPVMVEPNFPRFIRQGDKAVLLATVMNASDAPRSVATTFELLNPDDLSLIATSTTGINLEPQASDVVRFEVSADNPAATAMLIRVKADGGEYADAVQQLLPVLANSQEVIDSETFYLAPGENEFSMPVDAASAAGGTVVVSFCENPTWDVVSALPGLRSGETTTSLGASARIFAAATSQYVLDCNPEVKPALSAWLKSAKDEGTLLSMLSRNEDLKQLTLASTPWVQQAESDNARLTRLALLFENGAIDNEIASATEMLGKLQCSDGGWCWTDNYRESSEWVTMEILNNFAELRQLDCLPDTLKPMIEHALVYIDSQMGKAYEKYPDYYSYFYTYIRALYKDVPIYNPNTEKAYKAGISKMIANWKKEGAGFKAAAALTLFREGRTEDAKNILSSLDQFATYNPRLGMWWDSLGSSSFISLGITGQTAFILQAYNTIEPGCEQIDRIRQWLILNKIVQDWGTSVDACACVASILQCGSNWLYKPGNVTLTMGDIALKPSEIDSLTGSFHMTVDNPSGDLSIARSGESGPAWGALLSRSNRQMTSIEAHSLPELSIEKQILVEKNGNWTDSQTLAVGQTAKVRLVINSVREMNYVTIVDNRAATMEPAVQTPRGVYCDGVVFYLENRDAATNLFINYLPKGQYIIEYEMFVNNEGVFSSGIATIQSQYAPEMTAHSAGTLLTVGPK